MVKNIKTVARPNAPTVNDAIIREAQISMSCVHIGTIRAFDPNTQLANVEIAYKQVVAIEEDGTKTLQEYPLLMECPVIVLFGGVDILTLPIQVGDSCLVLFNDRDIDQWLVSGNGSTPQTARLHDLSDGIAIVGIRPLTNSIGNYLANGIRLSHGGGDSQMDLTDALITTIAASFVHNGNMTINGNLTVNGTLTSVDNNGTIVYNTHTHGGVEPGGGSTSQPNTA